MLKLSTVETLSLRRECTGGLKLGDNFSSVGNVTQQAGDSGSGSPLWHSLYRIARIALIIYTGFSSRQDGYTTSLLTLAGVTAETGDENIRTVAVIHRRGSLLTNSTSSDTGHKGDECKANYIDAVKALEDVDFPLVNLLKSKKDAEMDEVLDCFLLDGPIADLPEAMHLQPCLEQLMVPIHHAGDKTIVRETSLSFALMNVHNRAEGVKKHVAALRKLMIDIVSDPLSSQTWVGEASTSAAPLSVEDYQEEDTNEALGSVVSIPQLEASYL
ncbi:hypothetical protein Tco_0431671 [Tanacetum coccineum]